MKKLLIILSVLFAAFACEPDTPEVNKGKLDPNAMITIRPAKGVQLRSTVSGLTALEIVEQAVNIKWQTQYVDNVYYDEIKSVARTFIEEHKDYDNQILKMWGIDIITQEGDYRKDLTHAFNVVITDVNNDTIAYVPDEVINTARPLIETAYNSEDYKEVYRLFDTAFTFLPIE